MLISPASFLVKSELRLLPLLLAQVSLPSLPGRPTMLDSLEGFPHIIQPVIKSPDISEPKEDITIVPLTSLRHYLLCNERDMPKFDGMGRSDREIERYMEDIET